MSQELFRQALVELAKEGHCGLFPIPYWDRGTSKWRERLMNHWRSQADEDLPLAVLIIKKVTVVRMRK